MILALGLLACRPEADVTSVTAPLTTSVGEDYDYVGDLRARYFTTNIAMTSDGTSIVVAHNAPAFPGHLVIRRINASGALVGQVDLGPGSSRLGVTIASNGTRDVVASTRRVDGTDHVELLTLNVDGSDVRRINWPASDISLATDGETFLAVSCGATPQRMHIDAEGRPTGELMEAARCGRLVSTADAYVMLSGRHLTRLSRTGEELATTEMDAPDGDAIASDGTNVLIVSRPSTDPVLTARLYDPSLTLLSTVTTAGEQIDTDVLFSDGMYRIFASEALGIGSALHTGMRSVDPAATTISPVTPLTTRSFSAAIPHADDVVLSSDRVRVLDLSTLELSDDLTVADWYEWLWPERLSWNGTEIESIFHLNARYYRQTLTADGERIERTPFSSRDEFLLSIDDAGEHVTVVADTWYRARPDGSLIATGTLGLPSLDVVAAQAVDDRKLMMVKTPGDGSRLVVGRVSMDSSLEVLSTFTDAGFYNLPRWTKVGDRWLLSWARLAGDEQIEGKMYSAEGDPIGPRLTLLSGVQVADVTPYDAGFFLTWNTDDGTYLRRFDMDGAPIDAVPVRASETVSAGRAPVVRLFQDDFVMVWGKAGNDEVIRGATLTVDPVVSAGPTLTFVNQRNAVPREAIETDDGLVVFYADLNYRSTSGLVFARKIQVDELATVRCEDNSECSSGFCVDGVCCDRACEGTCEACGTPGLVGVCSPVSGAPRGTRDECEMCADGSCVGAPLSAGEMCGASLECESEICVGGTCRGGENGDACASGDDCLGGICTDGVCCERACGSPCKACDVAGSEGQCLPISGPSRGEGCVACEVGVCVDDGSGADAGTDAGMDAGTDAGMDTGTDAGMDAGTGAMLGTVCAADGECDSGFCVDGVCCERACRGVCKACAEPGTEGMCTIVSGAPRGTRTGCMMCDDGVCDEMTLGDNGAACVTAMECDSGHCVDGVCCERACTGTCKACGEVGTEGMCVLISGAPRGTRTGCLTCDEGVCDDGGGMGTLGTACTMDDECDSGQCTDGVCCERACRGTCKACGEAGSEGMCVPVSGAPRGDRTGCTTCDEGVCSTSGTLGSSCDDASDCDSGFCTDGVCCERACRGTCKACGEAGSEGMCVPVSGAPRGDRTGCATCDEGVCAGSGPGGTACVEDSECSTGFCTDGFCCERACRGTCKGCGEPGSEGLCVPVSGEPRGDRTGCTTCTTGVCTIAGEVGELCIGTAEECGDAMPLDRAIAAGLVESYGFDDLPPLQSRNAESNATCAAGGPAAPNAFWWVALGLLMVRRRR